MFLAQRTAGRAFALIALCCVCCLLISGCSMSWRFGKKANANNAISNNPSTQQLLTTLQQNYRSVKSFHVVMQVLNPGPVQAGQVQIRSANGDVLMPDKVKAQATVIFSSQPVTVNLISIDGKQYVTDPVTGQWRTAKGMLNPATLTNPDTGLISLVGKVQNPSNPVSDTINNTPCWRITGKLEARYVASVTGGTAPAGSMLDTTACIGKADGLLYHLKITGKAVQEDSAQTARNFMISKYNANVQISAPPL